MASPSGAPPSASSASAAPENGPAVGEEPLLTPEAAAAARARASQGLSSRGGERLDSPSGWFSTAKAPVAVLRRVFSNPSSVASEPGPSAGATGGEAAGDGAVSSHQALQTQSPPASRHATDSSSTGSSSAANSSSSSGNNAIGGGGSVGPVTAVSRWFERRQAVSAGTLATARQWQEQRGGLTRDESLGIARPGHGVDGGAGPRAGNDADEALIRRFEASGRIVQAAGPSEAPRSSGSSNGPARADDVDAWLESADADAAAISSAFPFESQDSIQVHSYRQSQGQRRSQDATSKSQSTAPAGHASLNPSSADHLDDRAAAAAELWGVEMHSGTQQPEVTPREAVFHGRLSLVGAIADAEARLDLLQRIDSLARRQALGIADGKPAPASRTGSASGAGSRLGAGGDPNGARDAAGSGRGATSGALLPGSAAVSRAILSDPMPTMSPAFAEEWWSRLFSELANAAGSSSRPDAGLAGSLPEHRGVGPRAGAGMMLSLVATPAAAFTASALTAFIAATSTTATAASASTATATMASVAVPAVTTWALPLAPVLASWFVVELIARYAVDVVRVRLLGQARADVAVRTHFAAVRTARMSTLLARETQVALQQSAADSASSSAAAESSDESAKQQSWANRPAVRAASIPSDLHERMQTAYASGSDVIRASFADAYGSASESVLLLGPDGSESAVGSAALGREGVQRLGRGPRAGALPVRLQEYRVWPCRDAESWAEAQEAAYAGMPSAGGHPPSTSASRASAGTFLGALFGVAVVARAGASAASANAAAAAKSAASTEAAAELRALAAKRAQALLQHKPLAQLGAGSAGSSTAASVLAPSSAVAGNGAGAVRRAQAVGANRSRQAAAQRAVRAAAAAGGAGWGAKAGAVLGCAAGFALVATAVPPYEALARSLRRAREGTPAAARSAAGYVERNEKDFAVLGSVTPAVIRAPIREGRPTPPAP